MVRNFWATIWTEGRERSTGPRAKNSDMTINLKVRENGVSVSLLSIACIPCSDGETLKVQITDQRAHNTMEYTFKR